MKWWKAASPEADRAIADLIAARAATDREAFRVADAMIAGVERGGDRFVASQIERFDGLPVAASEIRIEPRPVSAASIDRELARALEAAIERVESFHAQQLPESYRWTVGGTDVIHRVRPLRRVGIYVPGGRAVYVSTLIMCAVPARIAGVEEIVVTTPPAAAKRDELHYVCNRLGIGEIYCAGGAAGIAAMALGTESLDRVDKIVGPGNPFVTAAKARLVGKVGIDMIAGPTELVVIADDSADASCVQADLDAQQEHGRDSVVICIRIGAPPVDAIALRATLALEAESVDEAIAISDRIAPEHLSIHARDAAAIAAKARNAGTIYCGRFSPPAAGDYVVGVNHVLPTGGSARFSSPLGVYDFVRRTNIVSLSEDALGEIGPLGARIAELEGLPMHARSIEARANASIEAETLVSGERR